MKSIIDAAQEFTIERISKLKELITEGISDANCCLELYIHELETLADTLVAMDAVREIPLDVFDECPCEACQALLRTEALDELPNNYSSAQTINWLERNANSVAISFIKHGRFRKIGWFAKHDDKMLRDVVLEERKRQKHEQ